MHAFWLAAQGFYRATDLLQSINDLEMALRFTRDGKATDRHRAQAAAAQKTLRDFLEQVQAASRSDAGYDSRSADLFAAVAKRTDVPALSAALAEGLPSGERGEWVVEQLKVLRVLVTSHQRDDESRLHESC